MGIAVPCNCLCRLTLRALLAYRGARTMEGSRAQAHADR